MVYSMGGPRAFKEMQKKQQEFQNSWDQEAQHNGDPDEEDDEALVLEKRDLYAEYGIDEETENEKAQRVSTAGDTGEVPGQEDVSIARIQEIMAHPNVLQEFTMAMMLRTLNVDLHIIGYNKELQRWSD